jgi:hypothetical protein
MTDRPHDAHDATDEGALLAAYLEGETDPVTTARLERRLAAEPELARRLDALADTVQRLRRVDAAQPPPGFRARLDERLRAAGAAQRTTSGEEPGAAQPASSPQAVADRGTRRVSRWWRPLAAAAAVAVVAVMGAAAVLNSLAGTAGDDAAESAAAGTSADEVEDEAQAAAGDVATELPRAAADAAPGDGDAGGRDAGAAAMGQPEQSQAGTAGVVPSVPSDARLADRLRAAADATRTPAARERALRQRAGLPTEPLCTRALQADAVDVVERGGRVVVAVLVTDGRPGRIEVLDPGTCAAVTTLPAP